MKRYAVVREQLTVDSMRERNHLFRTGARSLNKANDRKKCGAICHRSSEGRRCAPKIPAALFFPLRGPDSGRHRRHRARMYKYGGRKKGAGRLFSRVRHSHSGVFVQGLVELLHSRSSLSLSVSRSIACTTPCRWSAAKTDAGTGAFWLAIADAGFRIARTARAPWLGR